MRAPTRLEGSDFPKPPPLQRARLEKAVILAILGVPLNVIAIFSAKMFSGKSTKLDTSAGPMRAPARLEGRDFPQPPSHERARLEDAVIMAILEVPLNVIAILSAKKFSGK